MSTRSDVFNNTIYVEAPNRIGRVNCVKFNFLKKSPTSDGQYIDNNMAIIMIKCFAMMIIYIVL